MKLTPGILCHGSLPAAQFVAVTAYQPVGGGAVNWDFSFAGMAAGDLAFIFVQNTFDAAGAPGAWTPIAVANFGVWPGAIFWKVLSAGDIAAGKVTLTNIDPAGAAYICAYRGPTAIALKTTDTSAAPDATLVHTGFNKAGGSKGIVSIACDRDTPSAFAAAAAWTRRLSFAGTSFMVGLSDLLVPASYVNLATITETGFTTGNAQRGYILEFT